MKAILLVAFALTAFAFCNSTDHAGQNNDIDKAATSETQSCDTILLRQLNHLISLAPTDFESLKGNRLSLDNGETAYSSTFTLFGTSHNKIGEVDGKTYYMGKISEGITKKKAQRLVKLWEEKIETCINIPATKQVPYRTGGGKSELRDGKLYLLNGDRQALSVYWTNDPATEIYDVVITVLKIK